ncbi:MAG TPA: hypothetical protein DEP78_07210 [Verrucomicrobiales bacterium]|nr:hypothetical protein [Verrucomicrobiales bacterium]HCQ83569.1 hypothetical protein [Verrucomicrobiales bacterium]
MYEKNWAPSSRFILPTFSDPQLIEVSEATDRWLFHIQKKCLSLGSEPLGFASYRHGESFWQKARMIPVNAWQEDA